MFKPIRILLKLLWKTLEKYGLLISLGIILGGAFFLLAENIYSTAIKFLPQTERVGLIGTYTISNMPSEVSKYLSLGLTEVMPNGRATESALVSEWAIKEDGKKYSFTIKKNLFWQDGKPLSAEEIKYNISGVRTSTTENTINFFLEAPFAPFPLYLSKPIFKKEKIGLGPYKIKKIRLRAGKISSLLLAKVNQPNQRILFRFYPDEQSLINSLKIGETEKIIGVSNIDHFKKWRNVTIKNDPTLEYKKYLALFFNTQKEPFNNKRVRQALAYAIEKPEKKDRALGPISPLSWAYTEKVKNYSFDPTHAKNILEKETDFNLQKTIKISSPPELIPLAEKIKKNWQDFLGIQSEIFIYNFAPWKEDFDVFLGYGVIPPDPDQYIFWHSNQESNVSGLSNPRIDQLLEKGRKTIDNEERKSIYQEFQLALSEEVPAIFLSYPQSYLVEKNHSIR